MANGNFAVTVAVVDKASSRLDAINRRIAALRAPAERFNRSLAKFGQVSGLSQTAEGIRNLGHLSLEAARSIEGIVTPLGFLTSAATIGGVAALTKRWADMGNQVNQTAYKLNMPVGRLSELEGAARLSGASAAAMDSSLRGLNETLSAARWKGDKVSYLKSLGIAFEGANGQARQAVDALDDVADAVARYSNPVTQTHILQQLGISEDMLPLLKNGRAGLEAFTKQARETGGVMTGEMANHATELTKAWQRLGLDVEGIGNRIVDSWSGTITKVLTKSSEWIEKNKETATSIAEIGGAVLALGALRPTGILLRLLGLGAASEVVAPVAAIGAAILGLGAVAGEMQVPLTDEYGWVIGNWGGTDESSNPAYYNPLDTKPAGPSWWSEHMPTWLGGGRSPTPHPASLLRTSDQNRAAGIRDSLARDLGLTKDQAAGIVSNLWAESHLQGINEANPAPGTRGGFGWAQWTGPRRAAFEQWAAEHHLDPASDAANYGYLINELRSGRYASVMQGVRTAPNAEAAAGAFFAYESDGDAALTAAHLADHVVNARQIAGLTGAVQVDVNVNLTGQHPTAHATAVGTGIASASPPRVETSMPTAR
jgi:hypothetical protein